MEPGKLEEQALKRKEKLRALKRLREGETEEETETIETIENTDKIKLPKPKFRSYDPSSENLKENSIPLAQPANIEEDVQDQLAAAKNRVVIDELDVTNLAPRKPDWDLKRDVAKRLEKLERRTQKAIAELIRERLRENQEEGLANIPSNM